MQQNAPTCTEAGRNGFLSGSGQGWAGGPAGLHKGPCPFAGWGLQGGAPKPPPCRVGTGAEPTSPRSQSNRDEVGAHPTREVVVRFPKGAKALWSMGVQGERRQLRPVR
ncbi:MAG: hypothetical protein IPH06_04345 [Alphaproteobacteria bacterium]|nr:hypothetical protein [Alphaproteobacteria bacterium]QQS57263.1 MAG: hypothetical protein IPN28_00105 [Alphaproteobacteria bacterium]